MSSSRIRKAWECRGPLWTPYYNRWNRAVSIRREAFREYPWRVPALSTSGSPFIWTGQFLVGLLGVDRDALFAWDGLRLEVEAEESLLFVSEGECLEDVLPGYQRALGLGAPDFTFGKLPEYCTWVEQFWLRRDNGAATPAMALEPGLVSRFLDLIEARQWPRGRFTVDDGWCPSQGPGGYGDWRARPGFDMAKLARDIRDAGHIPGLWMGPALISPTSDAARANPELLGEKVGMEGECAWNLNHYLRPGEASQQLIQGLFRQAYDWGYRKFKLDIFYGDKILMNELLRQCRVAADALPEPVELEGHVPDAFSARYCNVIRTNDVLIGANHPDWRRVAAEHVEVCRQSAPGHLLNLDHIGGNDISLSPEQFLEHIRMMRPWLAFGYPALSLLPGRYGEAVEREVGNLLNECSRNASDNI